MQIDAFDYPTRGHVVKGFRVSNDTQELPRVMFFRGGTGQFGALDEHMIDVVITPIAEAGFTVYASQYSGGPESGGKDEYGGAEVADIFDLQAYVEHKYGPCDSWLAYGYSRGALTACLAIAQGLRVTRAAFVGGMYDFRHIPIERPDLYQSLIRKQQFDPTDYHELERRSPIMFAEKLQKVPMLLLHAAEDARVPVRQAHAMHETLGESSVLKIFTEDEHSLRLHNRERNAEIITWLKFGVK